MPTPAGPNSSFRAVLYYPPALGPTCASCAGKERWLLLYLLSNAGVFTPPSRHLQFNFNFFWSFSKSCQPHLSKTLPCPLWGLMLIMTARIHLLKPVLFSNWSHHIELQPWENTWVSWASNWDNSALVSHLLEHGVIRKLFQMSVIVLRLEAVGFGVGTNVTLHYPPSQRWFTHTFQSRPAWCGFQQGCEGNLRGGMLLSSRKKRGEWQSHSQAGSGSLAMQISYVNMTCQSWMCN